jgi:hypothetical protein
MAGKRATAAFGKTISMAPKINHVKHMDVKTGGALTKMKNFFRSTGMVSGPKKKR